MTTIKVFNGFDIRRFKFDGSSDFNFENVQSLLKSNFKDLSDQHSFKYIDDEGDLCTLTKSTFSDAFARATSQMIRAEQMRSKEESTGEGPTGPESLQERVRLYVCEEVAVPINKIITEEIPKRQRRFIGRRFGRLPHPGIVCDSCDCSPIVGERYKCQECDDFDLCADCYDEPQTDEIQQHIEMHEFRQLSPAESRKEREERIRSIASDLTGGPTRSTERILTQAMQTEPSSSLSPRTTGGWTEVSIGVPHVEGLLRAFGVDVDNAKEAVRKFVATGDFEDIVQTLRRYRTSGETGESTGAIPPPSSTRQSDIPSTTTRS
jgi:hypothetical protein